MNVIVIYSLLVISLMTNFLSNVRFPRSELLEIIGAVFIYTCWMPCLSVVTQ